MPHQGGFFWYRRGDPIEILFMDFAKTWKLNTHYVREMLPCLIPDGALVQQDYVHYNEYWVHLTMEYFAEHFELSDVLHGATPFYCLVKPLSPKQRAVDLQALPYEERPRSWHAPESECRPVYKK